MQLAVQGRHERLVANLVAGGAGVDIRHFVLGYTPLLAAAGNGYDRIVFSLLLTKADKNTRMNNGYTQRTVVAAAAGHVAAAKALIAAGAETKTHITDDGGTALHFAAYR